MPAPCNKDDVGGGEPSACSMASKALILLLVKQMSASEGVTCHRAWWLRQLMVSSHSLAWKFAVQRTYQECCHPAPGVAACPHLGFPVPRAVTPPTRPTLPAPLAHGRPAGPSKQHGQGAPPLQRSPRDNSSRNRGEQAAAQISSASKQQPA